MTGHGNPSKPFDTSKRRAESGNDPLDIHGVFPWPPIRAAALAFPAFLVTAPVGAVDMEQTDKTFEGLPGGYRLTGTSTPAGLIIPLLFLTKDGTPSIYVCVQQFRNRVRLVDSASNPVTPPGVTFAFPAPPL